MPSSTAPRPLRPSILALLACAALCSCEGKVEDAGQAATALAPDTPIDPPIPCAIVSGPEDAQTLSQLQIEDGRVVRVVTRAEQREGQMTWEHKLHYDEAGHLVSVDKTVASSEVGLGMQAVTSFSYSEDGRLLESSYRDMLGRLHRQRWSYEEGSTRPSSVELLLNEHVIEQLHYDYEGAPTWTQALFLPGPRFGAAKLHAGDSAQTAAQTLRYDPQSGALVELRIEGGKSERYLYGDACSSRD